LTYSARARPTPHFFSLLFPAQPSLDRWCLRLLAGRAVELLARTRIKFGTLAPPKTPMKPGPGRVRAARRVPRMNPTPSAAATFRPHRPRRLGVADPANFRRWSAQPDRHPSLFRRRDHLRGALWRFAVTEKEKPMKYLTILCLSLGLAGCYCTGPYTGPVVDLSACADAADTRVDPVCHPLTRTQPK